MLWHWYYRAFPGPTVVLLFCLNNNSLFFFTGLHVLAAQHFMLDCILWSLQTVWYSVWNMTDGFPASVTVSSTTTTMTRLLCQLNLKDRLTWLLLIRLFCRKSVFEKPPKLWIIWQRKRFFSVLVCKPCVFSRVQSVWIALATICNCSEIALLALHS